ncbi:hypothetical protein HK098_002428 [Nowakowskiella sp. JEL0407]|nr:hypothetical protein HK098_002428 [Nowakowskiella sp. JEL0407]
METNAGAAAALTAVLSSSTNSRLEPFLLLAKNARGAAASKLIQDATSAPGVYVFAELLELPSIQDLKNNPQYLPIFTLLEIFAYGTYLDYKQNSSTLPPLNPNQLHKLKCLTIVSLSGESRILQYDHLLQQLDIPNVRELEDLIIDAIYQDIIKGKLDQKKKCLDVEYAMGRDVKEEDYGKLLDILDKWSNTSSTIISLLDSKISQVQNETVARQTQKEELEKYLENLKKDIKSQPKGSGVFMDYDMERSGDPRMSSGGMFGYGMNDYEDNNRRGKRMGMGTAFYHPKCIPEAFLNFDASEDGSNVNGFTDLSNDQKKLVQDTIKKASELKAITDPAAIKEKRKALATQHKKVKKTATAPAAETEVKRSGRVRQAPQRLMDEGAESDDEEEAAPKKKTKRAKKSNGDDEGDFAPTKKGRAKSKGRKKSKKDEDEDEEDEPEEEEEESDPENSEKEPSDQEEEEEEDDELDDYDSKKSKKRSRASAPKTKVKKLTGSEKNKLAVEEMISEVMKRCPAIHSKPPRPTDKQIEIIAKNMTNDGLKNFLRRTNQLLKGTKDELLERVVDRLVNGLIQQCPKCGGGRLLSQGWRNGGEVFSCPGFYDETFYKRCSTRYVFGDPDYLGRMKRFHCKNTIMAKKKVLTFEKKIQNNSSAKNEIDDIFGGNSTALKDSSTSALSAETEKPTVPAEPKRTKKKRKLQEVKETTNEKTDSFSVNAKDNKSEAVEVTVFSEVLESNSKKNKIELPKSKEAREEEEVFADSRGKIPRKKTDDGFNIYTLEELNIGKGGITLPDRELYKYPVYDIIQPDLFAKTFDALAHNPACVLWGPGGCGKSFVAFAYAVQRVEAGETVFWIAKNDAQSSVNSFRDTCLRTKKPSSARVQVFTENELRQISDLNYQSKLPKLIVLDDVSDAFEVKSLVRFYTDRGVKIIATTKSQNVGEETGFLECFGVGVEVSFPSTEQCIHYVSVRSTIADKKDFEILVPEVNNQPYEIACAAKMIFGNKKEIYDFLFNHVLENSLEARSALELVLLMFHIKSDGIVLDAVYESLRVGRIPHDQRLLVNFESTKEEFMQLIARLTNLNVIYGGSRVVSINPTLQTFLNGEITRRYATEEIQFYSDTYARSLKSRDIIAESKRGNFDVVAAIMSAYSGDILFLDVNRDFAPEDLIVFWRALGECRKLEHLTVYGEKIAIVNEGATLLANALQENNQLNVLEFKRNTIDSKCAQAIGPALSVNASLKSLCICDNPIGDEGAAAIATGLKLNKSISFLDLSKCEISDTGAKYISKMLSVNTAIVTLKLDENQIGDEGARDLSKALRINQTLNTLCIKDTSMGFRGFGAIFEELNQNRSLKGLVLSSNQLSTSFLLENPEGRYMHSVLEDLRLENIIQIVTLELGLDLLREQFTEENIHA